MDEVQACIILEVPVAKSREREKRRVQYLESQAVLGGYILCVW